MTSLITNKPTAASQPWLRKDVQRAVRRTGVRRRGVRPGAPPWHTLPSTKLVFLRLQIGPWRASSDSRLPAGRGRRTGHGFTLIELMLVMALLVIAMGVVYPSLSRFFRGQHLDGEARRLLGLIRFAQSQAISSGIPMQLWIDRQTMSYGLQASPGYLETDSFSQTYALEKNIELELPTGADYLPSMTANSPPGSPAYGSSVIEIPLGSSSSTMGGSTRSPGSMLGSLPSIAFRPDGSLLESSATQVLLRDRETEEELWIIRNPIRLTYEIIRPLNQ